MSTTSGEPFRNTTYEELYERHARVHPPRTSVGGGDYDSIGRVELSALVQEGLRAGHRLVDFGCGTGRLAVHAIPFLDDGCYVGIDISTTMLSQARHETASACSSSACAVEWIHHAGDGFPLEDRSVDVIAAFSVFTHMEHEDTFRYLADAARVIRPEGFVAGSFLTMDLALSRDVFAHSAALTLAERWAVVRNVTTTYDFVEQLASMAGWRVDRWYRGKQPSIEMVGSDGERGALGQSIAVLRPLGR